MGAPAYPAEVPPVDEAQGAGIELQRDVNVALRLGLVEPDTLPIQPEMHQQTATAQVPQKIFASPLDPFDALALSAAAHLGWALRAHRNGVHHLAVADGLPPDQRPQGARDSLDFGELRHGCEASGSAPAAGADGACGPFLLPPR